MRHVVKLLFLFPLLMLSDDSSESYLKSSLNGMKNGLWNGAGAVVNGLEGTVGLVGADQIYSFRVFNDAYVPIIVVEEAVQKFFGVKFEGTIEEAKILLPYSDTGDTFAKQQLLFNIWMISAQKHSIPEAFTFMSGWEQSAAKWGNKNLSIGDVFSGGEVTSLALNLANLTLGAVLDLAVWAYLDATSFYEKFIPTLGTKHYPKDSNGDPYTYYYRAYINKDGDLHGESLGYCTTSSDFAGIFYNSGSSDVSMTFTKDATSYTVTLEPGSFSMLESTSGTQNSIRPAPYPNNQPPQVPTHTFNFSDASDTPIQVPITPYGIASMELDPTTSKYNPGPVMTYTYEVFSKDNELVVAMQGLAIGDYTQPVPKDGKQVVRDINPMECNFWVQSVDQFQTTNTGMQAFIPDDVTFWLAYDTKDMQIYEQLSTGTPVDIGIVRPQISEGQTWMYICALETTDSAKAKAFLKRLTSGIIGTDVTSASTTQFVGKDGSIASGLNLLKPTPNTNGVIDDTSSSGVIGRVLGVDGFLPRGAGVGPYYYVVPPPSFMPSQLGTIVSSYIATATAPAMQKEINDNVSSWIASYQKDPDGTTKSITTFLQTNGQSYLFSNPKATGTSRTLNVEGQAAVAMITTGPISLKTPPIKYNAATNEFTFLLNHAPKNWPS